MFDIGFSELLLLGAIALIFIGPQQLPEVAKVIARLLNELKRATGDLQTSVFDISKDEILQKTKDAVQKTLLDTEKSMQKAVDEKPKAALTQKSEAQDKKEKPSV